MTWSLTSTSGSLKLQFCACFRSLGWTDQLSLHPVESFFWTRLSYSSFSLVTKYVFRVRTVFSYSVVESSWNSSVAGFISILYNSWTSISALWSSKAFFCASFTTPLATRKYWNDSSPFLQRGASVDDFPLHSNPLDFDITCRHYSLFQSFSVNPILVASVKYGETSRWFQTRSDLTRWNTQCKNIQVPTWRSTREQTWFNVHASNNHHWQMNSEYIT